MSHELAEPAVANGLAGPVKLHASAASTQVRRAA